MKKLASLFAILALAVLTGCATTGTPGSSVPQTPQQAAFALTAGYSVAEDGALTYFALPRCPVAAPICSDAALVAKIKTVDAAAYDAITAAQAVARDPNAGANLPTLVNAATKALAAFTAITSDLKAKQ